MSHMFGTSVAYINLFHILSYFSIFLQFFNNFILAIVCVNCCNHHSFMSSRFCVPYSPSWMELTYFALWKPWNILETVCCEIKIQNDNCLTRAISLYIILFNIQISSHSNKILRCSWVCSEGRKSGVREFSRACWFVIIEVPWGTLAALGRFLYEHMLSEGQLCRHNGSWRSSFCSFISECLLQGSASHTATLACDWADQLHIQQLLLVTEQISVFGLCSVQCALIRRQIRTAHSLGVVHISVFTCPTFKHLVLDCTTHLIW